MYVRAHQHLFKARSSARLVLLLPSNPVFKMIRDHIVALMLLLTVLSPVCYERVDSALWSVPVIALHLVL